MRIERTTTVEGSSLEELLEKAQPGDSIVLYEGKWDGWMPHPEGVVIQRGNQLLLLSS